MKEKKKVATFDSAEEVVAFFKGIEESFKEKVNDEEPFDVFVKVVKEKLTNTENRKDDEFLIFNVASKIGFIKIMFNFKKNRALCYIPLDKNVTQIYFAQYEDNELNIWTAYTNNIKMFSKFVTFSWINEGY